MSDSKPATQIVRPEGIGWSSQIKAKTLNVAASLERHLGLILAGIATFAFLVFLVALAFYAAYFGPISSNEHERWGQFGDYLGGVAGTFLSLLAVLAVLLTLWEQRNVFRKQHDLQAAMDASQREDAARNAESASRQLNAHHLTALINGRLAYLSAVSTNVGAMGKTRQEYIRRLEQDIERLEKAIGQTYRN